MKRFLIFSIIAVIVLATSSADALRISRLSHVIPPNGEAQQGVLYLFQKASVAEGPWPIVQGGAWGVLRYNLWGKTFNFVFQGRRLVPGEEYTLIYYPDPWPGEGLICLGSNKANPGGNLTIISRGFDIGTSLPAEYDANWTAIYPSGAVGAKIWLVLSRDVDCTDEGLTPTPVESDDGIRVPDTMMIGWTPYSYLFEYNLINFERKEGGSIIPVIPYGHMPPPGECRIWYPDRDAGQQPPPGKCEDLEDNVPPGAWLIRG